MPAFAALRLFGVSSLRSKSGYFASAHWRHLLSPRPTAAAPENGCGRVFAPLLWSRLSILDLATGDIDHELGELGWVARAFGTPSLGSAALIVPPLEGLLAGVVRTLGTLVRHVASMSDMPSRR
jgi:hypothetical protein